MALSRICNSSDLLTTVLRISHAASIPLGEMQCTRYATVYRSRINAFHVTSVRRYPDPPALPLPTNVSEIYANETGRFTPERSRDIAAPVLLYGKSDDCKSFFSERSTPTAPSTGTPITCGDNHVGSYDCFGAVSLNSTMQSNVPKPFCSTGKSTHLNMPGGQWARHGKYIAEDMQRSHYRNVCFPQMKQDISGPASQILATTTFLRTVPRPKYILSMRYTTDSSQQSNSAKSTNVKPQEYIGSTKKERFKIIVRDYGRTVLVFHIGISLISLGGFYAAVIGGLDVTPLVKTMLDNNNEHVERVLSSSSQFLLAYAIHKLFAPVRLSITLGVTPLLVKYLRRKGILKSPQMNKIKN
ncbi:protein FAM210A [Colletes latitarsis]|uniref:protein FAM210A n=1 Tax=Colletes latitarsis TaxID=2605962 RepID=UPI0040363EA1